MVNIRAPHFILFSLLLLINNISSASQQLLLFTDKDKAELGRPIRVELIAVSVKEKLSEIDLSPLHKYFGIITDYSTADTQDSRWPNKTVQILNLKLYPRQAGKIIIPELKLNKTRSKERSIHVAKGETGVPDVTFSSQSPYQRQQFTILVTLHAKRLSARLSIADNEEINGFDSSLLNFKRTKLENGKYLLQIGWSITALNPDTKKIDLPVIDYSESGVLRKKYYLPMQDIKIKKLPAYLPPTIPVGKITLHSQLSKTGFIRTNSIIYWHLQLKGSLSSSYQLPAVLRQIKSNDKIKFFPVNSNRTKLTTEDNLTSSVTHNIPLKVLTTGIIDLPEIKIQYFDPSSGKIINSRLQAPTVAGLNIFWLIISYIILITISIYFTKILYRKAKRIKYSRQQRKLAINLLKNEPDKINIRKSLKLLAHAEYWPENLSVTQWEDFWSKKYKTNSSFSQLMQNISHAYYSNNVNMDDVAILANKLIDIIENRNEAYNFKVNFPLFNF